MEKQTNERVPLYDHPYRFEALGRRRGLFRQQVNPDQEVETSRTTTTTTKDAAHESEPMFAW